MFNIKEEINDFIMEDLFDIDVDSYYMMKDENKDNLEENPAKEETPDEEKTPAEEEVVAEAKEEAPTEDAPAEEVVAEAKEEAPTEDAPAEEEAEAKEQTSIEGEETGIVLDPKEIAYLGQQTELYQSTYKDMRKDFPLFRSGDTISVGYRVIEGERSRIQSFDGVVIKVSAGHGMDKTFTVRKISSGIGVERIFPFHSPNIDSIKVLKHGKVRRAKLYYLRNRVGKATRIKERSS